MIKRLPFILIIVMISSIFLNPVIPHDLKRVIYAISLSLKSVVLFFLPFIIFGLLFKTFVKLSNQAANVILLIFGCLCTSNFFNTFITHYIGSLLYRIDFDLGSAPNSIDALEPYFIFLVPNIIKNEVALFGGIASGLIFSSFHREFAQKTSEKIDFFIKKVFSFISYIIPFFIIGFVIKCASDGILVSILKNYSQILLIFTSYATIYTLFIYFIINNCVFKNFISCLRNMMPAFFTAISTMSSVLTMPITILSTEKNVKNKELAGSVISATVNIHLLGDCLSIPILAYALLKNYGFAEPSLHSYFIFTIFFVIAKFSVAAVPAGGIIIMAPILEKYLGFTPEMSTLIIAIYVIFDPIVTGFNVLGNGALAKLIDNLSHIKSKKRLPTSP